MTRLQLVWWPRWALGFRRHDGSLGRVYAWSLWLGPLEIRRWRRGR